MRITLNWLHKHMACEKEVIRFQAEWPEGAELTEANLIKAADMMFDLDWFAKVYLPAPLRTEYKRQETLLWAEYYRQTASLWADYHRQDDPLWAEYKRRAASLWADYHRQIARVLWLIIRAQLVTGEI